MSIDRSQLREGTMDDEPAVTEVDVEQACRACGLEIAPVTISMNTARRIVTHIWGESTRVSKRRLQEHADLLQMLNVAIRRAEKDHTACQ